MLLSGGSKSPTALSTHHLPGSGTTLPDASSPPITSPTTTIPAPLAGVSGGDANTGEAALPFTAGNSSINGGIVVGGSGISGAAADVPADTPEVPTVLLLPLFGGGIFAGTVLLHRRRCTLLP
jgi:hypothetical protein